ncbi:MAG: hypothetical protein ABSH20_16145 [Tepidisphaeraceae bacterium]
MVPKIEPTEPEEDGLYDLAEAPPVAAVPAVAVAAEPLNYEPQRRDRFAAALMTHPPRDVYLPLGLLITGFVAMGVWAIMQPHASPALLAIIAVLAVLGTVIKTGLLIAAAIAVASGIGVSFGTLRTAILKFAAIIVVTDAAILWLEVVMQATGAVRPGRFSLLTVSVNLMLASGIIGFLCHYLFQMDRDETAQVALPLAVLSRLAGFLLKVLLVAGLTAMTARMRPLPAPVPAATTTMPVAGAPAASPGNAADRALAEHIAKSRLIREGQEQVGQIGRTRGHRDLVDRAQAAGAKKIYFDMEPAMHGLPLRVYVELPADPAKRAACFAALVSICQDNQYTLVPATCSDKGQRFVTVILGK